MSGYRYYRPKFDPDSEFRSENLVDIVAGDFERAYKPLSEPFQKLLIESFSRAVSEEAGYQYGYAPHPFTPDVRAEFDQARQRVLQKPIGSEVSRTVAAIAKSAGPRWMNEAAGDRAFGFTQREIDAFASGGRPASTSLHQVETEIGRTGVRYSDFETLARLSSPESTYGDLQEVLLGSFARSAASFAANRPFGNKVDSLQGMLLGMVEASSVFNPSATSGSGHSGYFLRNQGFYQVKADERSTGQSFSLSGGHSPADIVKSARAVLDEYTGLYGDPARAVLDRMGLSTNEGLNPDISRYIIENKHSILDYSHSGLGLLDAGSSSFASDVAADSVLYSVEENAMARLLPTMVGKRGLPLGYYTRSGNLFDDKGNLNKLDHYAFDSAELPTKKSSDRRKGDPRFAAGVYFTGTDSIMSVHNKGRSWTNDAGMDDTQNPAIASGAFKQLVMSPSEIGRFLNLDPGGLSKAQLDIYKAIYPKLKDYYSSLNAAGSYGDDEEAIQGLLGSVHADEAHFKPIEKRYGTIPRDAELRRGFIRKVDYQIPGSVPHSASRYVDTETGEIFGENQLASVGSQWRYPGGKWSSSPINRSVGIPADFEALNAGRIQNYSDDSGLYQEFGVYKQRYLDALDEYHGLIDFDKQIRKLAATGEPEERRIALGMRNMSKSHVRDQANLLNYYRKQIIQSETGLAFSGTGSGLEEYEEGMALSEENKAWRRMQGLSPTPLTERVARSRSKQDLRLLGESDPVFRREFVDPYRRDREIIKSSAFPKLPVEEQREILDRFEYLKGGISSWMAKNANYITEQVVEDQYDSANPDANMVRAFGQLGATSSTKVTDFIKNPRHYQVVNAIAGAGPVTMEARKALGLPQVERRNPFFQSSVSPHDLPGSLFPTSEVELGDPLSISRRRQTMPEFDGEGMSIMANVRFYNQRPVPKDRDDILSKRFRKTGNPAQYYSGVPMVGQEEIVAGRSAHRNMMIYGVPGSGKTHLAAQIAKMDADSGRVDPSKSLFLTGTTMARDVMDLRMEELESSFGFSGDFHQLGFRFLKRLSGSHGIPRRFGGHNIAIPLEFQSVVSGVMENLEGMPARLGPDGEANQDYLDIVHDYATASEAYRSSMMSQKDFGTKSFNDFVDKENLDPDLFKHVFSETDRMLRESNKYTFSMLISEPAMMIANSSEQERAHMLQRGYGGFSGISIDEINQLGTAALSMVLDTVAANPNVPVIGVGDPLQMLWGFINGSPRNAEILSEIAGMQKFSLKGNYRLDQGAVDLVGDLFGLPEGMRPSAVDERGNPIPVRGSREERIGSYMQHSYLAADSADRNRLIEGRISDLLGRGVNPKDILVQAPTKRELREIGGHLEDQGHSVFIKPDDKQYLADVIAGKQTPRSANMLMQQEIENRDPNSILLTTGHASQGSESLYPISSMSQADFASMSEFESRALVGVMASRGVRGGESTFVATAERGGVPKVLRDMPGAWSDTETMAGLRSSAPSRFGKRSDAGIGPNYAAQRQADTQAVINNLTPEAIAERVVRTPPFTKDFSGDDQVAQMAGAKVAVDSAREALDSLKGSPVTDKVEFARKFDDLVKEGVLSRAEQIVGEDQAVRSKIKGFANTYAMSASGLVQEQLGAVPNHLRRTSNEAWTSYHPWGFDEGGGGGGGGGRYEAGYEPRGSRGGWDRTWYGVGRGMYALSMAWRTISQGFEAEISQSKRYMDYMGAFAPFAAMEGDLSETEYGGYAKRILGERAMQKGAHEQFGAFATMPYALTEAGMEGLPRALSGVRTGVNTTIAGAQAAYGLSMMAGWGGMDWAGALAPVVGTGGAIAGGIIAGGTLAMEAYNAIAQPEKKASWGRLGDLALKNVYTDAFLYAGADKLSREKYGMSGFQMIHSDEDTVRRQMFLGSISQDPFFAAKSSVIAAFGSEAEDYTWNEYIRQNKPSIYWQVEESASLFAERVQGTAERMAEVTGLEPEKHAGFIASVLREAPGQWHFGSTRLSTDEFFTEFAKKAASLGYGSAEEYFSPLEQMAQNIGLMPGSEAYQKFIDRSWTHYQSAEQVNQSLLHSQRVGQYGSQLAGYFATPGLSNALVQGFGAITQPQVSAMSSMMSSVQMYGAGERATALAGALSTYETPAAANIIAGIANAYGQAGMDPTQIVSAFAGQNLPVEQLGLLGQIAGGDIGALSYASWNQSLDSGFADWGNRYYNQRGEPIYMRSGEDYRMWATAQGIGPNAPAAWAPGGANLQGTDYWQAYFSGKGITGLSEGLLQAWEDGGLKGAQRYTNMESAKLSLAGVGIQFLQVQARKDFLWGSGSWDAPGEGSLWNIQDQLRSLQHTSTVAGFQSTERSMQAQWEYGSAMENINLARMNTQQDYQRWTFGFDQTIRQQQRLWTQEDWQYQDTMRGLGFEWDLEDLDEQIRGATGRQRRLLIRQRDRTVTKHNLESEQVDTQRERQEETWALEDERYQKVWDYQENLMSLDRETFDLNKSHREEMRQYEVEDFERRKKEYEEQRKLQEEQIKLQREFEATSIELQEKSLGIQAASAKLQLEMAETQEAVLGDWKVKVDELDQANRYEPSKGNIGLMSDLVDSFAKVNKPNVESVSEMINRLSRDLPGADSVVKVVRMLNSVDPYRINMIIKFLAEMD